VSFAEIAKYGHNTYMERETTPWPLLPFVSVAAVIAGSVSGKQLGIIILAALLIVMAVAVLLRRKLWPRRVITVLSVLMLVCCAAPVDTRLRFAQNTPTIKRAIWGHPSFLPEADLNDIASGKALPMGDVGVTNAQWILDW
jgi:hypothetical protein